MNIQDMTDGDLGELAGQILVEINRRSSESGPTPDPTKSVIAPDCYDCLFRGTVPGSCHSSCDNQHAHVQANVHGIRKGWFNYPFDFDPVWLQKCDGFVEKEARAES